MKNILQRGGLLCLLGALVVLALACASPEAFLPASPAIQTPPLRSPYTAELTIPSPADPLTALLPGLPPIPQDLPRYEIQVAIDYAGGAYRGRQRVEYTNQTQTALQQLYFRLYPNGGGMFGSGSLAVSGVLADGQPANSRLSLLSTVLEVDLPRQLYVGERIAIEMDFAGSLPRDFGGSGTEGGYGIFNLSQSGMALAGWYPILAVYGKEGWDLDPVFRLGDAVYSQAALYTVELIVDSSLVVVSSGSQVEMLPLDGWRLYRYASGPARDFFIFAAPDHLLSTRQAGGVTVNSYYLPGHADGGEQAADVAARALEIFTQDFGPYPYPQFNVIELPLNLASGVEYPSVALVASRLYADLAAPDLAATVAHEVAHQWWYNVVGNDVIDEPWVDEALASYASLLYWEQAVGAQAFAQALAYHQTRYDALLLSGSDDQVAAGVPYFVDHRLYDRYSPVVYSKGVLFFQALRQAVGDPAFFSALQGYYAGHWFSIASGTQLEDAFEAASGQQLDILYEAWLYSPATGGAQPTPTPTPLPTPLPSLTPVPTLTPASTQAPAYEIFAVIGDFGSRDEEEEKVANLVLSWNPEFIITVGDNNYPLGERDTLDEAVGQYFHSFIYPYGGDYGEGSFVNRFFPTLGNHDLYTDEGQPYYDYFDLPGNERYYDFVMGPVHFFALNSNDSEPDGVGLSSAQAQWLQAALAGSTSPWNLVYMHHPPYSSGNSHGSIDWAQWPYAEWGASAVLAGHEHVYERLEVGGIPYFVNGLGGGGIYGFNYPPLPYSLERYDDEYGAMLVEATDQSVVFQFININNEVVDLYTLQR